MLYVIALVMLLAFAAVCLIAWLIQESQAKQMAELKVIRDAVEDVERRMISVTHLLETGRFENRRRW